jgi:manganese efflux pump family protein
MGFFTLVLLALGLSADAFAVSVSNGMCSCRATKKNALTTAVTFGFFQALMPVLGFILGKSFSDIIYRYHHWVALLLLSFIGINMISDAIKEWKNPEDVCSVTDLYSAKNLSLQGIATSIDALAAGVSFAAMQSNIITASLLIGVITMFCCAWGVLIGRKFGTLLGLRAKLIGGVILILIGVKIFCEHLNFG